jgi:hypothetical protein
MKSFLTRALMVVTIHTSFLAYAAQPLADQEAQYLTTDARPKWMEEKVQASFEAVSQDTSNNWMYNGDELYQIAGVNEHRLILNMISENPNQKDFYVLDFGCGVFTWGKALQSYLNEKVDETLRDSITVHVVGITGGIDTGVNGSQDKVGCCKLYGIPTFPIENIKKWQQGAQWPFIDTKEVKFDLIVSRSTFQHLVDPIGTLIDTYNWVRLGGYLIADILEEDLSCIARFFEVSLSGLCDGCVGHALSLVAVGGSTGLKIPVVYNSRSDGSKYTWLTDNKTYFYRSGSVGFGKKSRQLAEYLVGLGAIDDLKIDAQSAKKAIIHRKSRGEYSGEIPESDDEIIALAKQIKLNEKYLSGLEADQ